MAAKRKTGRPAKVRGEKGTKEKIFDAAVNLFAERGYDGVSIRDVATAVGIKESSIYKHYASKDEILEKIVDYPMARIGKVGPQGVETEELIVSMGLEGFMALGSDVFTSWMEDPHMEKIWRIICIELYHNEQIKKFYAKFVDAAYSFWVSNFTIMMRHKLIKPSDPTVLAMEYLAFYGNAYMDYFIFRYGNTSGSFPQEYRDHVDQHTAFMVNSIRP